MLLCAENHKIRPFQKETKTLWSLTHIFAEHKVSFIHLQIVAFPLRIFIHFKSEKNPFLCSHLFGLFYSVSLHFTFICIRKIRRWRELCVVYTKRNLFSYALFFPPLSTSSWDIKIIKTMKTNCSSLVVVFFPPCVFPEKKSCASFRVNFKVASLVWVHCLNHCIDCCENACRKNIQPNAVFVSIFHPPHVFDFIKNFAAIFFCFDTAFRWTKLLMNDNI